jgi:diamine N-acetyltransferase
MEGIVFSTTDIREIERIRPLWLQLNEHHHERARAFRTWYETVTFDDRKRYFEKAAKAGILRIALAQDPATGRCVGYCAGSLTADEKYGEIESVFVEAPFRSSGVGTALVRLTLAWMDAAGAVRKRVAVSDGNEEAWAFYRRFGFYPRLTVLEQTRE